MKKIREYHNLLMRTLQQNRSTASSPGLSSDAYKRYKTLAQHEKIACLINNDDLRQIEMLYKRMTTLPDESKDLSPTELTAFQLSRLNRDLFGRIMQRIFRVLKNNYLSDYHRMRIQ